MRNSIKLIIVTALALLPVTNNERPPRLIGKCEGKVIWADEEDNFPYNCLYIRTNNPKG